MAGKSKIIQAINADKIPGKWDDLESVFEELEMTPLWAMTILKNIAEHAEKERDQLKAIDLWSRLSGYKPPDRVFVNGMDGMKIEFGEGVSGE